MQLKPGDCDRLKMARKGPRKVNGGPVRGTDPPVRGADGPVTGTRLLLMTRNFFELQPFLLQFLLSGFARISKKGPSYIYI